SPSGSGAVSESSGAMIRSVVISASAADPPPPPQAASPRVAAPAAAPPRRVRRVNILGPFVGEGARCVLAVGAVTSRARRGDQADVGWLERPAATVPRADRARGGGGGCAGRARRSSLRSRDRPTRWQLISSGTATPRKGARP